MPIERNNEPGRDPKLSSARVRFARHSRQSAVGGGLVMVCCKGVSSCSYLFVVLSAFSFHFLARFFGTSLPPPNDGGVECHGDTVGKTIINDDGRRLANPSLTGGGDDL